MSQEYTYHYRKLIWFAEKKKETKIALEVLILIYKVI
jgi:hypothetical protein